MPLETVELRFQYTQSEYIKVERQYLISSKTIHKYDMVLVAVLLLMSVVYMLFSSFGVFSILIFGLIIVVTALGSYLYILMPILKFKQTEKYHEEYTLVFSMKPLNLKHKALNQK